MSPLAYAIVTVLKRAQGREQALTSAQIAVYVGTYDRAVRECISREFAEITAELPLPLCAIPPYGFWLTRDAEDLLKSRAWISRNAHAWQQREEKYDAMLTRHGLSAVAARAQQELERRAA